jgi:hypothetical protein
MRILPIVLVSVLAASNAFAQPGMGNARTPEIEEYEKEEEAKREQSRNQLKREFQAFFGDPLLGLWVGEALSLDIKKEANLYVVKVQRWGKPVGEFAAPLKDDQLALGTPGTISLLRASGELLFATERLVRVRKGGSW